MPIVKTLLPAVVPCVAAVALLVMGCSTRKQAGPPDNAPSQTSQTSANAEGTTDAEPNADSQPLSNSSDR